MDIDRIKADLRKSLRARRRALSQEAQDEAARRLAANVAATHCARVSRHIACYLPNDGEISPDRIVDWIWRSGRYCYLPVLSQISFDRLWFAPLEPDTPLVPNRFGILEPVAPARERVRAQQLDLILMPLVGFDAAGNRLGMGGGFYDRSLQFLRHRWHWHKPRVLGIAHDFQRLESLPRGPWDIPMHGVITDRDIYMPDGALR